MTLTLVTGRANTGKTGVLHRALREALAEGRPATLLLPTVPDVRRTEAELGRDGLVGARVAVFDDWVDGLWLLHGDGRRPVTPGARTVLLRRALETTELDLLRATAGTPGLVRLLADVSERLTCLPEGGRGVEWEIARVLRCYHGLAEREGMIERSLAARRLAEDPPDTGGPVLANRFTSLSEAQELLLTGLSRSTDVVVALTWEPDLPATAAVDPLIERMFAIAAIVPCVAPPAGRELARLEERLYCPGAPIVPEGELEVGLAAGDEAECAMAARAARALIEEGIAAERVAVVFRDAGRRRQLLAAALASEGLAADIDVAVPVSATPFGAALAALVDACRSPSRERLLALLLSPFSDADPASVAAADSRWRRSRVSGERLLRDASALGPLTARALAAGKRAVAGLTPSTAAEWRRCADALLAAASIRRPRGSPEIGLDAAAHRALLRAIDECTSVRGAETGVRDVLDTLAEIKAVPGAAERPGAVQVTEIHRIRSRRFDGVVLGGLTAEEFSAERSEPLAAEIAVRLGAVPGMRERDAERMLFYLATSRARRKLVLLRQESDERGEPKRPSVFWDEVADLYANAEDAEGEPRPWPPGIEPARLGLADLAAAAPAYAPGRRRQRAEAAGRRGRSCARGVLRDERVLEALARTREFSVTELETYLSCPYRWFYERAVRPLELDVEVDARERGSRAHRLLAAFYTALEPELGISRVVPERLDDALALLERTAERVEEEAATHAIGVREELAVAQVLQWARAVVEDDARMLPGFEPIRHELAFGEKEERPFALGGVALRGSIDRVDGGPAGLVVMDYKSERQPSGQASLASRRLIQLPVYAAAASALLGMPVAGAVYRSLRSLAARGFRLPEVDVGARGSDRDVNGADGIRALVGEAAGLVSEAAAGIRAGAIPARPVSKTTCASCGARPFCGRWE